jgi:hypothetical protein
MNTLSDATELFIRRGYRETFVADNNRLRSAEDGQCFRPDEFIVDEVARFEGESDPDDQAAVFALRTRDGTRRGTYTVPFGPMTPLPDTAVVRRLALRRPTALH